MRPYIAAGLLLQTGLVLSETTNSTIIYGSDGTINLSSNGSHPDIVVIDYGHSVEGHPTFKVVSASGDTSGFELTFAESNAALNSYMSDGPLPLAAAMETYRVNKYNISEPGLITNRLIQGAFRYEKLNLSTAGSLILERYTGARTAQLTEIPHGSVPDFWQVTDQGALVEDAAPQALSNPAVSQATSYEIDFDVKPLTGEFVFSVLSDTLNDAVLITCNVKDGVISSSTSSSSTIPTKLNIGEWMSVHARVNMTNIEVSINNQTALKFTQTEKFYGSFGLGAPLGHSTYYRNLRATTLEGVEIYSSDLKDRSFLDDFFMGDNPLDTIVDGSRRDRIAYSGDLDIAISSTFASTYGKSFVAGSLDLVGSYQTTAGFWIPNAKIQQAPLPQPLDINITGLQAGESIYIYLPAPH
ncbi:unnamed protein product, partial [Fusarium langsethiae]